MLEATLMRTVCLALVAPFLIHPAASVAEPKSVDQAIARAFEYFEAKQLRGDQLFFVSQAALLLGGDWPARTKELALEPGINHPVELGLIELRFRPIHSSAFEGPELNGFQPRAFSPALTPVQVQEIFFFMQVAIECQSRSPEEMNALASWLIRPGSGYLLAHQLVALQIAESLGCVEGDSSDLVHALARRVYQELSSEDTLDDLVAEQIAVLCLAGYADQIPQRYFEMLLAEQGPDGDWGVREVEVNDGVFTPAAHTAALALYGLACYQQQMAH